MHRFYQAESLAVGNGSLEKHEGVKHLNEHLVEVAQVALALPPCSLEAWGLRPEGPAVLWREGALELVASLVHELSDVQREVVKPEDQA
ncbi:hypothetical protein N8D77_14890 [Curtobacterium flaccumfaciens]|uniref:hypothetical protein n=1 Tax=Curtobacterium flaccumfaciens TaxID=2035 RepID=UPI0021C69D66|nr:hypothetical protein [Curtobacterium flaccumfaciens]UXN21419.1 hypothetical protein N8D77_14890 [Curtobacterium flaccumfaciens pv. flaccumfaciens]